MHDIHPDRVPVFKCILVGDGGIGKTTFVKRHLTGEFCRKYLATMGVEIHSLVFYTNHGAIKFEVWDTSGQETFEGLRDGYYINSRCAILMFDLSSKTTYDNLHSWYRNITRLSDNIPIVLVGNKAESKEQKVKPQYRDFQIRKNMQYYDMSTKSRYNLEKPFLWLAKQLFGEPDLIFTMMPALAPPELVIDSEMKAKLDQRMVEAINAQLPPDDDVF